MHFLLEPYNWEGLARSQPQGELPYSCLIQMQEKDDFNLWLSSASILCVMDYSSCIYCWDTPICSDMEQPLHSK